MGEDDDGLSSDDLAGLLRDESEGPAPSSIPLADLPQDNLLVKILLESDYSLVDGHYRHAEGHYDFALSERSPDGKVYLTVGYDIGTDFDESAGAALKSIVLGVVPADVTADDHTTYIGCSGSKLFVRITMEYMDPTRVLQRASQIDEQLKAAINAKYNVEAANVLGNEAYTSLKAIVDGRA